MPVLGVTAVPCRCNQPVDDNTWTAVWSALWSARDHQRQDYGEQRTGATQHPSAVPRITLIGPAERFVSKKLSGDSAFGIV
jgi:hypothetical protein